MWYGSERRCTGQRDPLRRAWRPPPRTAVKTLRRPQTPLLVPREERRILPTPRFSGYGLQRPRDSILLGGPLAQPPVTETAGVGFNFKFQIYKALQRP